ncbi:hypothetical protein OLCHANIL_00247 [Vibrio phage V05]|nr:hypothetical protein [Vibrio phage vB_ValP_IME271]QBJ00601.1 hypothetical protein [Vibrio phage vB_VpP_BA6]QIW90330.1 hypothetical protein OLCHANIL_00247 [Vibrio phage V05]QQM14204.1 hypothetical protein [Vibrio phage VpJYP1]WQZ00211.1 hypothetical protein vBValCWD615_68 [Vibrio phage vB_ValC_WD615]BBI55053.1 hypothetical protein KIT05_02 [Vibrio phage KIT05]
MYNKSKLVQEYVLYLEQRVEFLERENEELKGSAKDMETAINEQRNRN